MMALNMPLSFTLMMETSMFQYGRLNEYKPMFLLPKWLKAILHGICVMGGAALTVVWVSYVF